MLFTFAGQKKPVQRFCKRQSTWLQLSKKPDLWLEFLWEYLTCIHDGYLTETLTLFRVFPLSLNRRDFFLYGFASHTDVKKYDLSII